MEKEPRKLIFRLTPWIFLLAVPLFYADVIWKSTITIPFKQRLHYISSRKVPAEEKQESLDFILSKLLKGEDQNELKNTGFACNTQVHSKHCVTNQHVRIDTRTMTVTIPSNQTVQETVIRPYARQEDDVLLKTVTRVRILQGNTTTTPPVCQHNHQIPAVIFSTSGFTGNVFHEFNEIIIPLFITTRLFKSDVVFIVEDYRPSFITKYSKILAKLTSHEIINSNSNRTVHCFPGAVVGLNFHYHLTLNSSKVPIGLSMQKFRQFLRETLNLKYSHVSQIKTPTVMLLSRTKTRRIINEDEIISVMEELGFRVIVVSRAKVISNLEVFSRMINSCSVLVGAHGAGLTNEIFLADGAVMVQVDLIGLNWAARTYYGNPAHEMGIHYLRYKIEAEESSLFKVFGSRNHTAIRDPSGAFPMQVGKEVYLNGQNVRINVARFRETMVEAISLVPDSPL